MKKIGILGGTFNPIHNGHIKIAQLAKQEYHLDRVIFLTSGNPPHKRDEKILDAKIRHIMVKRAISGIDGFVADDYEVEKEGLSYTLYTLEHYKTIYPEDEIYFIIGGDSLRDFYLWHKPDEIVKLCRILVYNREKLQMVPSFAKAISGDLLDISSTQVRRDIRSGKEVSDLVPAGAMRLIKKYNLYGNVEDYEKTLKSLLNEDRFIHSLGVRDMAVELARIHGADVKKAEIAGLLHDNAKNLDCQAERCSELEAEVDEFEWRSPALLHAKLGAETAKCFFGITDREITEAIKWHTVGKPGMTLLEKIIFVADLVEENRTYPDAAPLRKLAKKDLDAALLACVRATVEVNKSRGNTIHPNAYKILGN